MSRPKSLFISVIVALFITTALSGSQRIVASIGPLGQTIFRVSFVSVLLIISMGISDAASPSQDAALVARLEAYWRPYVDGMNYNGVVLVAKGGRVLLREAHGVADVRTHAPLAIDSRFHLGQLSEAFTATGIFLLVQRGKIRLDDHVSQFVPGFTRGDAITIRALLTHDTGLPGTNSAPGTPAGYTWASAEYVLLGKIIERITGTPYGQWMRENIFQPLGMQDTGDDGDALALSRPPVVRHFASGPYEAEVADPFDFSSARGSASLYSTVDDLFRFDRALRTSAFLSTATVSEMFATRKGRMADGVWRVNAPGERKYQAVTTRAPGAEAGFERYPDDDVCVVLLSNVFSSLSHSMADELAAVALGEERVPVAPSHRVTVPQATLDHYVGQYELGANFISTERSVEVIRTSTGLAMISKGFAWPSYLVPRSQHEFTDRMYGGIVTFMANADGQVVGFRWKRGRTFEAVRTR